MVKRVTAYRNEKRIRIASNWKMCRMAQVSRIVSHRRKTTTICIWIIKWNNISFFFCVIIIKLDKIPAVRRVYRFSGTRISHATQRMCANHSTTCPAHELKTKHICWCSLFVLFAQWLCRCWQQSISSSSYVSIHVESLAIDYLFNSLLCW